MCERFIIFRISDFFVVFQVGYDVIVSVRPSTHFTVTGRLRCLLLDEDNHLRGSFNVDH